jgi:hypothetical protein
MLTNKITGETRLIVLITMIIQALILEQMSVTIFMESLTNNGARIAMPTVEWKNGTHNMRLIKAGLVMIQQKNHRPSLV